MQNNRKIIRCPWADNDEKMSKYHDEVWGVPVHDDQKLFAKLSLDLMQAMVIVNDHLTSCFCYQIKE